MSPLAQTGLTLVCMGFAYAWGLKSGLYRGSKYICEMLTKKELERIMKRIHK